MPFRPISDRHAIVEVVFGLIFKRHFSATEIEGLLEQHEHHLKEELPKVGRTSAVQIVFGEGAIPPDVSIPAPTSGVTFDAVQRDGTLGWRLKADDKALYVNCLIYSNWTDTWQTARNYLKLATDTLGNSENPVVSLVLQYIDVFEWQGEEADYDLAQLLDVDSPYIPKPLWRRGPLWHLHQGWYRSDGLPAEGRLLERIHLDGTVDRKSKSKRLIVKMDTFLNLTLKRPCDPSIVFRDDEALADGVFVALHDLNKQIVSDYITAEMAERISLNV